MKNRHRGRTVLFIAGGIVTVFLMMAALLPFLEHMFAVEVAVPKTPQPSEMPVPIEAEALFVTAVYEMNEERKITKVAVEVFSPGADTVYRLTIPANTRVTLSTQLYKSLQAYSPELPQYLKLSNMAEGFSEEYVLTGCNRILSELLGITIEHAVGADSGQLIKWQEALQGSKTRDGFFSEYENWLEKSLADLSNAERWIYYESYRQIETVIIEEAAGIEESDGFALSVKQAKTRLEELMRMAGAAMKP